MARRKLVRRLGVGVLILLLTVVSLVAFLLFALQTPWGREQVRTQLNAALAPLFQGRIEIQRLGGVGLLGVDGVDAVIFDPAGKQVIRAQGLSAVASLPSLALEFVRHPDAPEIDILSVRIDHADVTLREDEELGVTIASTFLPREEEPESAPSSSGPSLRIRRIALERVWAHGTVSGSPALDAELTGVLASMSHSPAAGFELALDRAELVSRALPLAADPSGQVSGNIEVPADESRPLRLEGNLEGHAARSPLSLTVTWIGDHLHAGVSLPRVPAEFFNQHAQALALDGDVTLIAEVEGELPELGFWLEVDGTAAHVSVSGDAVVASGMEVQADVAVARFDARRMADGAPQTDLRLAAHAVLWEDDDATFVGAYRAALDQGKVGAERTPAMWSSGELRLGATDGFASSGRLGADEPGASARGSYQVSFPDGEPSRVHVDLAAMLEEPERLAQLGVRAAGEAKLSGQLWPESGALSAKASLSLRRVDVAPLQVRSVEAALTASGTLDNPRVKGAATLDLLSGRAHADLDYSPTQQSLALFAVDLDLVRLGLMLGTRLPIRTGTVGVDARLERTQKSPHFVLDGKATANAGPIGQVTLVATGLELPQAAPTIASLSGLRGTLRATGRVELAELSPLLTEADLPIERTTGRVRFELSATRVEDAPAGLELAAFVDTNGLRVVGQRKSPAELGKPGTTAVDAEPQSLEGIDVHLAARVRPGTGLGVGTLILRDRGGTLLELQAEAQLAELWPGRLTDAAALAQMPLRARLIVSERRLQSLPPLVRPPVLRGRVSLEAMLEGSLARPRVDATFSGRALRTPDHDERLDVDGTARFTLADGEVALLAKRARTSTVVADVRAKWRGDLRRAAEVSGDVPAVEGGADVKLSDFPLDVVPLLADRQIKGKLSGDVKLVDWGRDARLDAELRSNSLVVSRIPISNFRAQARAKGGELRADVTLNTGRGALQASLDAAMRWGRRVAPELGNQGVVKLAARGFRLETLSPLVGTNVSEIGGELDAQTEIRVAPGATSVTGHATLARGVVQLPAIGQRFSNIKARVSVADDRFKLERLEAQGLTGKVTATGSARLDGFALRAADARISIKQREMLPITLEGAAIGDAWGNVTLAYESPERGLQTLEVNVPEFHLITPETSGKGLQSLEEPAEIRVGVRRADGVFVPLPVQPLEPGGGGAEPPSEPQQPLRIDIKLGNNVTVERGRAAQAQLTGQLRVMTAPETAVTGRIEVRGGKLDVQGKRFEIERGVVTFDGRDPANPTITATARWDAPEYTVYADYVGDVENGRIKLRSEPPLSQDEIASLLLFGSPDGTVGGGASTDETALAVSVAGETAAKGLNQVLDDFTNLDVSARVDTTTGSARPELVMRVSPRVTARVTRAVGAPAAGESPDRTFLTLELRLRRAWALSAVLGDRGASALDLIWRRRY